MLTSVNRSIIIELEKSIDDNERIKFIKKKYAALGPDDYESMKVYRKILHKDSEQTS